MHNATDSVTVNRHMKQNGQHVVVQMPKPLSVHDYNRFMGGIDVFDRVASYRILRKTRKWWKTLFFDSVDVAVVNSYLLYREWVENYAIITAAALDEDALPSLSQLEFREFLIRELAHIDPDEPVPLPAQGRPKKRHVSIEDDHPSGLAPSNQRRNCIVCYRMHHVEHKTRYFCNACTFGPRGRKAFMCISEEPGCWDIFHSCAFDPYW